MNVMDSFGFESGSNSSQPKRNTSLASDFKTVWEFIQAPAQICPIGVAGALERIIAQDSMPSKQLQVVDYVLNNLRVERGLADFGGEGKLLENQICDHMDCSHEDLFHLQIKILPKLSGEYQRIRAKCLAQTAEVFGLDAPEAA